MLADSCLSLLPALLLFTGCALAEAEDRESPQSVCLDFADAKFQEAVKRCPGASLSKDSEGETVLSISASSSVDGDGSMVSFPLDIEAFKGYEIVIGGDVKAQDVSKSDVGYHGVKFMLQFDSKRRGWMYPEFLSSGSARHGTWGWTRQNAKAVIPIDAVSPASLRLGLQGASGVVSYRNVRIARGDAAASTFAMTNCPRAQYTVNPPRQRGVMSPDTTNGPREEDFAELAKWGANNIRWQMSGPRSADGRAPNLEQIKETLDKRMDDLEKVLALGKKYGIMIVVDVHCFSPSDRRILLSSKEGQDFLVDYWTRLARRYRGNPMIFGYDLLNEPVNPSEPEAPSLAKQYERIISAIRSVDPTTPVIVECDVRMAPGDMDYLPVYNYPNIIYSFHMYNPLSLTHQLNPEKKMTPYPCGEIDKLYLAQSMEPARKFQKLTGARIYVGEFSCARWVPGASQYIKDCIDLFEDYGWDWSYHAFREWHGWSVEHSDDPSVNTPAPNTERKQVLLNGLKKNLDEPSLH